MQRIILIFLTFFLTHLSLSAQELNSPSSQRQNDYILILSSYNYKSDWSTGIAKKLSIELDKQLPGVVVSTSYASVADCYSFLSGRFGMQAAFVNGRVSKNIYLPSVLILIGDEGWMYYRKMKLRAWNQVPVVLVGVNEEIMDEFSEFYSERSIADNSMISLESSIGNLPVTAVVDKEDEAHTIDLMKQLIPDLQEIVFLSTGGYQDAYTLRNLQQIIPEKYPELELRVIHTSQQSMTVTQKQLSTLSEQSAILVGMGDIPEQIDTPVFLLRDRDLTGKSVVGGYYPSQHDYARQVADVALLLYQGVPADSLSFLLAREGDIHLNKTTLRRLGLLKRADEISNVIYKYIPTPFWFKHIKIIFLFLLTGIVSLLAFFFNFRGRYYRSHIIESTKKYKRIHDEYQIVYDNMPIGLLFFDEQGNLLHRNENSNIFFDKVPPEEASAFNLFQTTMIDEMSRKRIARKMFVNKVFTYGDRSLHLIFRSIRDEEGDDENILMIVLDYTAIQEEKEAKERIHEIFDFAMNASSLGVAEYNLVNKQGIATEAWYKNLYTSKEDGFSNAYHAVVEEDRKKIESFLANIGESGEVYFTDTIRVKDGDAEHWLYYVCQLLEYGSDEGRVIVAELVLNVDKQKYSEQELSEALREARETDRLKNAFIANMSSDIRPALEELVVLSNHLISAEDNVEKESLMARIEQNNDLLLNYVERIIEMSRADVKKEIEL